MKYISTRSSDPTDPKQIFSFRQALELGYAPDGGLFVPSPSTPLAPFTQDEIKDFVSTNTITSFAVVAFMVLRKFVSEEEIPDGALNDICIKCVEGYEDPKDPFPVVELTYEETGKSSFFLTELFHGPTFCFKDLGQQLTIRLLSYFLNKDLEDAKEAKENGDVDVKVVKPVTAFVSTTGDTGPAALQAAADANCPILRVVVAHPDGQVWDFVSYKRNMPASPFPLFPLMSIHPHNPPSQKLFLKNP